jgi:hypothetical protein
LWHVSSSANRESIFRHGLDWRRMGAAPGIAGSSRAEQQGCFLCLNKLELDWFLDMNNTGGPVDVWEVSGVDQNLLVESPEGHHFLMEVVPPASLRLLRADVPPTRR